MSDNDSTFKFKLATYFKSKEWADIKVELILSRGNRCQVCNKRNDITVHHLTWDRVFKEEPEDLMLLCRNCARNHKEIKKRR